MTTEIIEDLLEGERVVVVTGVDAQLSQGLAPAFNAEEADHLDPVKGAPGAARDAAGRTLGAGPGLIGDEEGVAALEEVHPLLLCVIGVSLYGARRRGDEFIVPRPEGELVLDVLRLRDVHGRMPRPLDTMIGHVEGEAGTGLVFVADEENGLAGLLLELVPEILHRRGGRLPAAQAAGGIIIVGEWDMADAEDIGI